MFVKKVLTKAQQQRTLKVLEKLVASPERKDLLAEIEISRFGEIDSYGNPESKGHCGILSIAPTGLIEKHTYSYDFEYGDHRNWATGYKWEKPVRVKPSLELVSRHGLTEDQLEKLLADLQC